MSKSLSRHHSPFGVCGLLLSILLAVLAGGVQVWSAVPWTDLTGIANAPITGESTTGGSAAVADASQLAGLGWFVPVSLGATSYSNNRQNPPESTSSITGLGGDAHYYYYYHGQRIPLSLSTEWISVRFEAALASESRLGIASQNSVVAPFSERMDISLPPLTLLKIRPSMENADVERAIASLRTAPGIVFANPIFDVGPNTKQALTDEFLVRFKPHLSEADINFFNAEHSVQIVDKQNWKTFTTYLLKTVAGPQQNALDVANEYFVSGKVEYAEPNFLTRQC